MPFPTVAVTAGSGTTINTLPDAGQQTMAESLPVVIASNQSAVPVSDGSSSLTVDAPVGTPVFVRLSDGTAAIVTLPISAASLPLPTGAAAEATLAALNAKVTSVNTGAVVVSSSALPSGAATAAKQPSLGTAGTPSADVISIQGVASGTVIPVSDGGGSLTVDGSVSVSGVVPGTSATSLGKAEDSVAADGDTGVAIWAVRKDVAATTVGSDGDYHPFEVDANGRLWTNGSSVTQPVSIAAPIALAAGTNNIGDVGVLTLPALPAGTNNIGDVDVLSLPALPSGTNNIGDVDVLTLPALPTGTNTIGAVRVVPGTSGGWTPSRIKAAASTNATSVKVSAGQLGGYALFNNAASARYVKFYNKASAPTVGTDVPLFTVILPASGGANCSFDAGIVFSTGIAYAITTGVADSDTGACTLDDVQGVILTA